MKKTLFIILGLLAIPVAWWLISPLFIEKKVSEKLEDISMPQSQPTSQPEIIAQGEFSGLAGHSAQGAVKLLKMGDDYYVRFENDFRVTNGPDLFVYFGKDGKYVSDARLDALKGNVGSQNYLVPKSLNVNDYGEVWVWCRAFSVPFAKSKLTF